MRSLVFTVVSFVMAATAASSQKAVVPPSSNDVSQEEQQIRQLESAILKGVMNSDPTVFERILADDYVVLNNRETHANNR